MERVDRALPQAAGTQATETVGDRPDVVRALTRELAPGARVGRYTILSCVGEGGMGVVYAAYDSDLDRRVALKLLHPSRADSPYASEGRVRLLREAQAMARVVHPNVVAVYDAGAIDDCWFIAMEFVAGRNLASWLRQGEPRPWREVLACFLEAGEGLAAAHAAGLVHRDFKAENVLVGTDGRCRVTDFGLARVAAVEPQAPSVLSGEQTDPKGLLSEPLTQHGAIMGTPAYMAPEQHQGGAPDTRTDQFSFAASLYRALYGELPYQPTALQTWLGGEPAPALREATTTLPAAINRALRRALSLRPDDRYPSLRALLDDLSPARHARRRRYLAIGASALVLASLLAVGGRYSARKERLCRGASAQLTGAWDAPVRSRLERAFLATGRPYAADIFARTATLLDGYASDWSTMRQEACEAARVRGDQTEDTMTLRMLCLDRARDQLRALGQILAEADASVLDRAIQAGAALPAIAECGNVAALRRDQSAAHSPAEAARINHAQEELARIRALLNTGRYAAGLELSQALGRSLGHDLPRVRAENALLAGALSYQMGKYKEAERILDEGASAAAEGAHPLLLARNLSQLALVVGFWLERTDEGFRLARHARALLVGLGGDPPTESQILNSEAMIKRTLRGDLEGAIADTEQAIAVHRRVQSGDDVKLAILRANLAGCYLDQGTFRQARALLEQSLASSERLLGPRHPQLMTPLLGLATALVPFGEYAEASRLLKRAIDVRTAAVDRTDLYLGDLYIQLAETSLHQGDVSTAIEYGRRAEALRTAGFGEGSPQTAVARLSLAATLLESGDPAGASRLGEPALRLLERLGRRNDVVVVEGRMTLGKADLLLGRRADGARLLGNAVAAAEQIKNPLLTADARFSLAEALGPDRAQRARARQLAEAARPPYAELGNTGRTAEIDHWLATHPQ
jgi:tetratricopeptide (TPR) repeat protein